MTARDTYYASLASNHTLAEHTGIGSASAPLAGAPALPGNASSWSRDVARAALHNGLISQSAFNVHMLAISGWEQAQNALAKATLRGTGDNAPV